jgi:hypothetical protein
LTKDLKNWTLYRPTTILMAAIKNKYSLPLGNQTSNSKVVLADAQHLEKLFLRILIGKKYGQKKDTL